MTRPLTPGEKLLIRWMLEHGTSEAPALLTQLDQAQVTSFQCPCGCASIELIVNGLPEPSGAMGVVADFTFGTGNDLSGIFVYEKGGVLAGVEVSGYAGNAPRELPPLECLTPIESHD